MSDAESRRDCSVLEYGSSANTDLTPWERGVHHPILACLRTAVGWVAHPRNFLQRLSRRADVPFQRPGYYMAVITLLIIFVCVCSSILGIVLTVLLRFPASAAAFRAIWSLVQHMQLDLISLLNEVGFPSMFFYVYVAGSAGVFALTAPRNTRLARIPSSIALWATALFPMLLVDRTVFTVAMSFMYVPVAVILPFVWLAYALIVFIVLSVRICKVSFLRLFLASLSLILVFFLLERAAGFLWVAIMRAVLPA